MPPSPRPHTPPGTAAAGDAGSCAPQVTRRGPRCRPVRVPPCRFPRVARGAAPDDTGRLQAAIAAVRLFDEGHPAAAVRRLDPYLHAHRLATAQPDIDLVDACTLYATVVTSGRRVAAAGYAWRASTQLYPDRDHPRWLAAAHAYATVLHTTGRLRAATGVYRDLLAQQRALGRYQPMLITTVNLSTCLHTTGHCTEAIRLLATAWQLWQHSHLSGATDLRVTTTLLNAYTRQLRACRQDTDLQNLIQQIRRHPTWQQLAEEYHHHPGHDIVVTAHQAAVCTRPPPPLITTPGPYGQHHPAHQPAGPLDTPAPRSASG